MSLDDLIYSKRRKAAANANPAKAANPAPVSRVAGENVSKISNLSISKTPESEAANDPTTAPTPPGRLYLPGGPSLDPASVNRMRAELVAAIEELADMEQWDAGRRDDVLTRAIRGPLADLMPNLAHFNERLTAAQAEAEARRIADGRSWRVTDEALRRRGVI